MIKAILAETVIDNILKEVINFLGPFLDFTMKVCYEVNDCIEYIQEDLVFKDDFLAHLHNVEHGVTGCLLNFYLLVFEAL
jgi:hypothetical protein